MLKVDCFYKGAVLLKWELVESRGNPPLWRWGHSFTKIAGDQVVVYDGTDDDEQTLGDLHVFDTTRIAEQLQQINLLLPFGGERNSSTEGELDILSDTMLLDTESFSWYAPAIQGSPPSARTGHTCTALGNEVVVFGGSGGRNRQSSVHILDCGKLGIKDDHIWKTVIVEGKVPSSRTYHSAVAVGKDKIVYFEGNDSCKSFNDVHVLHKVEKSQ
ncbi:hypothetical protein PsorP6_002705 [Peronosclerospora sorghi]|uniref:Uncharacterized protein n=1 Tax=Peronosclerospora sorghi TaxID=230839 RepID=A0ACC0WTL0_9STRA|nr:hypothetical protein PsorP6_002705 [Peronosclerospora sorghi]